MKRVIFTIITVLVFSVSQNINAQKPQHEMNPQKISERQTERLKEDLGLNAEQEQKVAAINLKFAKQSLQIRQSTAEKPIKREKMQLLRKERRAELKSVLTDAQFKKMVAIDKERMQKRKNKGSE